MGGGEEKVRLTFYLKADGRGVFFKLCTTRRETISRYLKLPLRLCEALHKKSRVVLYFGTEKPSCASDIHAR